MFFKINLFIHRGTSSLVLRPPFGKLFFEFSGKVAEWVRALSWTGDQTVPAGFEPHCGKNFSILKFGNCVYLLFGGETESCRSFLSGVYARGSKISHQSALEMLTVVDSTTHSKTPRPPECDYVAENAALHLYRKKKKHTSQTHRTSPCMLLSHSIFVTTEQRNT